METVCHVITKLELGGAQEVALYAVSHLDRTRFRSVLVAGPGGLLTEEARRLPGVQTIILPSLGRRIHAMSDLLALIGLYGLFRSLRPAIVHTHSSKAGVLGRWAAWLARVPVIIHTVHGFGITPTQPAWIRSFFILLERMTGWITTQWIMVARADVERGRQWGLFDANVSVVRPGIDPCPFFRPIDSTTRDALRREFGAGPGEYLVGTVACLKPQKAPEDFVRVAKTVCEISPQVRFVLIGDGELRPHIESLIERYGLRGLVCLAGWRRDIDRVMHSFDALLLTSRWEGLPRVMLEASAAGLPIVATKVGGVEEAVTDKRRVRLCEAGDIAGLARAVVDLHREQGASKSHGAIIQRALPKEFHIEEMVKEYQSLYDRLLSGQGKQTMAHSVSPVSRP